MISKSSMSLVAGTGLKVGRATCWPLACGWGSPKPPPSDHPPGGSEQRWMLSRDTPPPPQEPACVGASARLVTPPTTAADGPPPTCAPPIRLSPPPLLDGPLAVHVRNSVAWLSFGLALSQPTQGDEANPTLSLSAPADCELLSRCADFLR